MKKIIESPIKRKTVINSKNNTMGKIYKTFALTLSLMIGLSFTSCVQDDDFTIPKSLGNEENEALTSILENILAGTLSEVSISELKGMYQDNMPEFIDTDIVVKGYVSSSDQTGNFFKEIYLQDAPENPTAGIKIALNQVETYNQFNKGREVYIKLKGLYVGEERVGSEVIVIGGGTETDQFGTTVLRLTLNQIKANMFRSENTLELVPLTASFSDITKDHIGLFVKFEDVEFANDLEGLRYFDPIQDFDTQRTLQSCDGFDYSSFILETSSFASFKNELLPSDNGSISGVITKDFTGSVLLLALNTTDDVAFTNSRCTLLDINDFSPIFEEDFESMTANANVSGNGWTNYTEVGRFSWRVLTTTDSGNSGSKIASMGAFNSGNPSNIAWLISPGIDLDAQDLEFINFKSSNSFSDGSELELLISTDWDGNTATITTSTWTALPGIIVSDSEFFQNWVDSGAISLSSYSGTAYIAFKYIGGDNAANTIDGNFEIDNFKVLVSN